MKCHILKLKCIKFDFGEPQTPLGELTALPRPIIAGFQGQLLSREGGEEGREGRVRGPNTKARGGERGEIAS